MIKDLVPVEVTKVRKRNILNIKIFFVENLDWDIKNGLIKYPRYFKLEKAIKIPFGELVAVESV